MKKKYLFFFICIFWILLAKQLSGNQMYASLRSNSAFTEEKVYENSPETELDSTNIEAYASTNDDYAAVLPNFIPPSPETASLFRYVEHSSNNSNGIFTLDIPVYEIRQGSLSLPIKLNYEASGRRAYEQTGPVGIGWSLNTGASISRTINGKCDFRFWIQDPDQYMNTALKIENILGNVSENKYYRENIYDYLKGIFIDNYYDTEYDIFTYYIPGHSGHFILYYGAPILLDASPVKISLHGAPDNFLITDDKGINYYFDACEFACDGNDCDATGWQLEKVVSADKKDEIKFDYYNKRDMGKVFPAPETYVMEDDFKDRLCERFCTITQHLTPPLRPTVITHRNYNISRIDYITFGNSKLKFELKNDESLIVDKIKIMTKENNHDKLIKYLEFTQSNIDNRSDKFKMDRLTWKDGFGATIENYQLFYNASTSNSDERGDFWGFRNYNGSAAKFTIPRSMNRVVSYGDPNGKSPIFDLTKEGVLNKIVYPTGGYSEFEYEPNGYLYFKTNTFKQTGGLRIAKIKTTDPISGEITNKVYKYGIRQEGDGYGEIKLSPYDLPYFIASYQFVAHTGDRSINYPCEEDEYPAHPFRAISSHMVRTYSSNPTVDAGFFIQIPVHYNIVSEIINDSIKTVYSYESKYENTHYSMPPIRIPSSPGFINVPGHFEHEFECIFEQSSSFRNESKSEMVYGTFYDCFWKKNNLLSKEEYLNKGQNNYTPLKYTEYTYRKTPLDTISNLKIRKLLVVSLEDHEKYIFMNSTIPIYQFVDYHISRGRDELIEESEVLYTSTGSITNIKEYSYDADYSLLRKIEIVNSEGKVTEEGIQYPLDYNTTGNLYEKMVELNMIGLPISHIHTYNNTRQSVRYNYKDLGNNQIRLFQKYLKIDPGPERVQISYEHYDSHGNPLSVIKNNSDPVAYLWSYNYQYPIAEIKNASYTDIKAALAYSDADIEALASESNPNVEEIDTKLRLFFKNKPSLVTTYTYEPLVGIKKMNNTMGIPTDYTYDTFGRLKQVSYNGEVVNEYEYNYANE